MVSHAAMPVVRRMGGVYRVYFAGRDGTNRSHIGWFDLSLEGGPRVRDVAARPVLAPGALGTFDDSGVTPCSLVECGDQTLLYYAGWSLGVTVPFYLSTGLAVSSDGGATFRRYSEAPLLDRSAVDPYLATAPWVVVDSGRWRMWYVSGSAWRIESGRPKHWYHIRYAESLDGVNWDRRGVVCIDYASPDEHAFGRPCVVQDDDLHRMWYPYRGTTYRIGYAESRDGVHWQRRDAEAGIEPSDVGWDSEMLAYPSVFDHAGERYMLYNGNGYGRTGIGLAVLDRHHQ